MSCSLGCRPSGALGVSQVAKELSELERLVDQPARRASRRR